MTTTNQKQVGDLVRITGGRHKTEESILHEKTSRGWNVKLKNGKIILTAFPFIVVLAKKGEFEDGEPWKSILAEDFAEDKDELIPVAEPVIAQENTTAQNTLESPGTVSETTGDAIIAPGKDAAQAPAGATGNGRIEENTEVTENIAKMTMLQLRELAKQKGVAIARTKADFLRIIKEKNPGEDPKQLKGKVLFDRVSELHISRLRSKEDLQTLLS